MCIRSLTTIGCEMEKPYLLSTNNNKDKKNNVLSAWRPVSGSKNCPQFSNDIINNRSGCSFVKNCVFYCVIISVERKLTPGIMSSLCAVNSTFSRDDEILTKNLSLRSLCLEIHVLAQLCCIAAFKSWRFFNFIQNRIVFIHRGP